MITVQPLSERRGAQGIDRLAAGAGNRLLGHFGIDCGLIVSYPPIKLTASHISESDYET